MKNIFCLILMSSMLVACGNSDTKLPQDCKDIFTIMEETHTKLETNRFATASMAATYKQLNIDKFIPNFKKALSKADYEKQALTCKPIAVVLRSQLDQLNKAKSEAEIRQIFSGL